LLNNLVRIDGIERMRFFTSHPKDITLELIEAMKHPKVCDWLHLPVQSGDDEILSLMARQHDTDYYRNLISELKGAVPTLCLSSDIIVGFPGETREQFENTLRFVEEMEFEWVNTAAFSKRPGTPAESMVETISETEKYERLHELNAFVKAQVYKYNQQLVGNTYQILIEGVSRENPGMLLGKTTTGKTIFVGGTLSEYGGRIVNVRVTKAASWVIYGEMVASPDPS
jgi:tRNA-2-methylthio-N6-dimethylallyladenosine synthase